MLGYFSGRLFQGRTHRGKGSSLAWPFVGNPKKQYVTCTVLVALPAMECGGNLLLNIVAIVGISAECLCWLRLILYFRNVFHYALIIISKMIWFCVVSIFDYHKKKSPPSLRLHCVCGGRSYGSFIFQKHFELALKFSAIYFKDK